MFFLISSNILNNYYNIGKFKKIKNKFVINIINK